MSKNGPQPTRPLTPPKKDNRQWDPLQCGRGWAGSYLDFNFTTNQWNNSAITNYKHEKRNGWLDV